MDRDKAFVLWFDELRREDVALVGGKSSSLGELTSQTSVPVPYGFATTAEGTVILCAKRAWMKRLKNFSRA